MIHQHEADFLDCEATIMSLRAGIGEAYRLVAEACIASDPRDIAVSIGAAEKHLKALLADPPKEPA